MKCMNRKEHRVSRRKFVKTTATGIGAGVVVGIDVKETKAGEAPFTGHWDRETDVVVVGFGGAGLSQP
jgi:hypothetical protein